MIFINKDLSVGTIYEMVFQETYTVHETFRKQYYIICIKCSRLLSNDNFISIRFF